MPRKGMPSFASALHRRLDDLAQHLRRQLRRHRRGGGVGAHAAGVRPGVAVEGALVVLRGGERQHRLAVADAEEARFLALEELLDDDLVAEFQELAHRFLGRLPCLRDDDALAGGETVGLDDARDAGALEIGDRLVGIREPAVGGGRDAVAVADALGEGLRALELGGQAARPEGADARRLEIVDEARHERPLRPDHHEIDAVLPAERDDRRVVVDVEVDAAGDLRDAGIARRGIEVLQQRAGAQRPGERVLASTRSDQ